MSTEDRFVGTLLGVFCGDALGMPVEGWTAHQIRRQIGHIDGMLGSRSCPGTYTDDTEMMIGVAESLLEGAFCGQDMARRFLENCNPERGYGSGTTAALDRLRKGVSWLEAGMDSKGGSFGNGAAMRVAPLALLYDGKDLRRYAELSSVITHSHPLGKAGAVLQAHAVRLALCATTINPRDFLEALMALTRDPHYKGALGKVDILLRGDPPVEVVLQELGSDTTALRSVPTAVYCFLREGGFRDALCYSVNLGGDTDTVGALTGALAGAFHGRAGIPDEWCQALETGPKGRDYVERLARGLWKLAEKGRRFSVPKKEKQNQPGGIL